MAYIAKFIVNNNPNELTNEERAAKFDSMLNDPDFLGVQPGNPIFVLYSTEQAAQACVTRELSDSKVSAFLDSAEVVSLESENLEIEDFYDFQAVSMIRGSA